MYSGSALQLTGERTWHATARTVSGSYLATYIPCGMPEGEAGSCLTTGAASWMAASLYSPQEHQAFIGQAGDFYHLRGYQFNNKELGLISALCAPMLRPADQNYGKSPFEVRPSIKDIEGPFKFSIINMEGKILYNGDYRNSRFDFEEFNKTLNLSSGIYILRIVDKYNNVKVTKFHHP